MTALILYFAAVADDGDWMNDWLTHLPTIIARLVEIIGIGLAAALQS